MKDGRRCTVSDTYLKAATDVRIDLTPDNAPLPPGGNGRLTCLNVKSNCHVLRLLFDSAHKTAVTGVEFFYEGEVFAVKATREVILSAGAINTPQVSASAHVNLPQDMRKSTQHSFAQKEASRVESSLKIGGVDTEVC